MARLEALFARIDSFHNPRPCRDEGEIDRFEQQIGSALPSDLKAFYRKYHSVRLFDSDDGAVYRFVPIGEVHPTRIDIYGRDEQELGPGDWLTVCDVLDGNYIAMDLGSRAGDLCSFIDCFHETFAEPGSSKIIARSFTELLEQALESAGSLYYLQKDFTGYGDGLPLTAETASIRIENEAAPRRGWLVRFTTAEGSFRRFFADDDYGGKQRSDEAVRQFVREKGGS